MEVIDASSCAKIKIIQELGRLTKLRFLQAYTELPGGEHLMSLDELNGNCPRVQRGWGIFFDQLLTIELNLPIRWKFHDRKNIGKAVVQQHDG